MAGRNVRKRHGGLAGVVGRRQPRIVGCRFVGRGRLTPPYTPGSDRFSPRATTMTLPRPPGRACSTRAAPGGNCHGREPAEDNRGDRGGEASDVVSKSPRRCVRSSSENNGGMYVVNRPNTPEKNPVSGSQNQTSSVKLRGR